MPKEQETSAAQVIPESCRKTHLRKSRRKDAPKQRKRKDLPVGCGKCAPIGDVISFDFAKTAQVIPVIIKTHLRKSERKDALQKIERNNLPVGCGRCAPIGNVISFDFAKTAQVIPVWYYQDAFAEKQAEGRAERGTSPDPTGKKKKKEVVAT